MVSDETSEEQKISKINAAGLINLTLKNLWEDFYGHLRAIKYSQANGDLDCLWVEFGGDLGEDDDSVNKYEEIDKKVAENFNKIPKLKAFENYKDEDLEILGKQYKLLLKKALFLRRLQNKQGKGTAYRDGSEDYMEV